MCCHSYSIGFVLLLPIGIIVTSATAVLVSTILCNIFKWEKPAGEPEHEDKHKDVEGEIMVVKNVTI